MGEERAPQSKKSAASKRTLVASLAALSGLAVASGCCLPLTPFLLAAGAAGGSAFFVRVRPFLSISAVLLIGFGFYQSWRAKQCRNQPSLLSTIVLWFSASVVLVFTLFPQAMANLLANLIAR